MKTLYPRILKIIVLLTGLIVMAVHYSNAQTCTPQGDQTTYGTGTQWIGYVYQGKNFDTYTGYVTEGSPASSNFDESFGGAYVTYNTNGCSVYTEGFSVRYKLNQNFANANYLITVGGDDGYRLSLDGGVTWVIDKWNDQGYGTTTYSIGLNGHTQMVLEYYENGGDNRISFNVTQLCTGTGDPSVYGTNNVWNGYIYQGMNFEQYKGQVSEGAAVSSDFDENFGNPGGGNVTYATNSCSIQTQQFSARYRLTKTFPANTYTFVVGGDDGYRLSLDGGNTWVINQWNDQGYAMSSYNVALSGTYNMVLEYYQDGGADRVSITTVSSTLPVTLTGWSVASISDDQAKLSWQTTDAVNFDHFVIQRSTDGISFQDIHTTPGTENNGTNADYSYTDQYSYDGDVYYRLVMVDKDGSSNYSKIISVSFHNTSSQNVRIFPTVVENSTLFIEASKSVTQARLELFDMNGARISEKDWSVLDGRQQVSVSNGGANLRPGAYIARLSDGHSILARQILIVK